MSKTYKDYCREAVKRDPKLYGKSFDPDGSRKPAPKMAGFGRGYQPKDIPPEELAKMEKVKWVKVDEEKPQSEIRGKEIPTGKGSLKILPIPTNSASKEYNRVWMHNYRVRKRLEQLKKQYGAAKKI